MRSGLFLYLSALIMNTNVVALFEIVFACIPYGLARLCLRSREFIRITTFPLIPSPPITISKHLRLYPFTGKKSAWPLQVYDVATWISRGGLQLL